MRSNFRFPTVVLTMLFCCAVSPAQGETAFESFENQLAPWRADVDHVLEYRIVRSRAQAQHGAWSVDFTADGTNDDGTLWLVRELQLPAGTWNIGLQFHVWSSSGGPVGAWDAIGYIGLVEPQTELDFTQSSSGQDLGAIGTAGWASYGMSRTISVGAPTTAYVAFGYNIIFEVFRTHYFDSVTLTGIPIQCGNGTCFAGENPCNCAADCGSAPATESACTDAIDNDCDGFTDCVDVNCSANPACAGVVCDGDWVCESGENVCDCDVDCGPPPLYEGDCEDGIDNDCDGPIDCDDTYECGLHPNCTPPPACDNDGTCESGESCITCPTDCFSAGGPVCGNDVCETANGEDCLSCLQDCNGKQSGSMSQRYCCGDGAGQNPVGCSDARCTANGNTCSNTPAPTSCCGDGACTGAEGPANCAVDCPPECAVPADCNDGNSCTTDQCNAGVCANPPLNCNDGNACTTDSCLAGTCVHNPVNCNDGNACTTDGCNPSTGCTHTPIPGCGCGAPNAPCSSGADCCSNNCRPNGRCR